MTNPQNPPVTAVLVLKASKKISLNVGRMLEALLNKINIPIKKYKQTIKGTKLEVTLTMDFKPPKITVALIIDSNIPMKIFQPKSPNKMN